MQIYSLAVGVCCKALALAASAFATNTYVSAINLHQGSAADLNPYIKHGNILSCHLPVFGPYPASKSIMFFLLELYQLFQVIRVHRCWYSTMFLVIAPSSGGGGGGGCRMLVQCAKEFLQ